MSDKTLLVNESRLLTFCVQTAMYVLPKALESAWSTARKRAWVPIVPFGETILGAAAMAMVMDTYKVRLLMPRFGSCHSSDWLLAQLSARATSLIEPAAQGHFPVCWPHLMMMT